MSPTDPPRPPAPADVGCLMDGYLITQLLYVAVKLGIGDALAAAPRTAAALAEEFGVQGHALRRVLRGLAAEGFLEEHRDGSFSLAATGECLRSDAPNSLRGAIIARGELYYRATAGLLESLRKGGSAYEHVHGMPLFAHLAKDAASSAIFQDSMTDRARHEAEAVVAAYDFSPFRHLVDLGGGEGVLLSAILRTAPQLRAVLVDQAPVVARARARFESMGLGERCEFVPGNIIANAPVGGDLYVLSRVLHNWDDGSAHAILAQCCRAMAESSKLLLVEVVLPERARDNAGAIRMDLHMLALLAGRERTAAEYESLLRAAGLVCERVIPTRAPAGIAIIEAAPLRAC